jgi:hypothetical protein
MLIAPRLLLALAQPPDLLPQHTCIIYIGCKRAENYNARKREHQCKRARTNNARGRKQQCKRKMTTMLEQQYT